MSWAESYHGRLRAFAGDDEVLIMIGARCLLRDDEGRVLLIERSDNGLWAVPAGGIELTRAPTPGGSARTTFPAHA